MVLLVALASIALAACGGSSSSSSSSSSTSTSAKAPAGTPPGAAGGRFLALRECLKKNGVVLPKGKPGAGGLLGGTGAPKGTGKAQYEAALKKCGGRLVPRRGSLSSRLGTPQAKQALAKFAACMRENGAKVGEPNTSGKGAVFSTKGIDTRAAAFLKAESKCRGDLRGAFGATPGAAGANTAPPAGAGG